MKFKLLTVLTVFITACILLCGCDNGETGAGVSQLRTDILYGTDGKLEATAYCEMREIPLSADGIADEKQPVVIVKISSLAEFSGTYSIFISFGGEEYSAQPEQRSKVVMRAEIPVKQLPEGSLELTLKGENETAITLNSIRPEGVCDYKVALKTAKTELGNKLLGSAKKPEGEFFVRLLCEDGNAYWYVGYVTEGTTYSLLLSADGNKVLATRSADTPSA